MGSFFKKYYSAIKYPVADSNQSGLRNAQLGAIHAIAAHFTIRNESAIITMPTGSGKTGVLLLTAFVLRANRVLVITPSRLVRNQIKEQFKDLGLLKEINVIETSQPTPKVLEVEERIGNLTDWEKLKEYDVTVATPNSISPGYENIPSPPEDMFDLILVDEAHHSPAHTWDEIFKAFPNAKRILFTATPFRADKREIKGRFVYTYPLRKAYADKIYGEIEYAPVMPQPNKSNDRCIAEIAEKVFDEDRVKGFNHYLMVRTDSKKRAKELAELYGSVTKLKLKLIHSGHTYRHIKNTIEQLRSGELDGIICVDMLGEGFDFPNLKIAAIHSPHKSLEVTLQFIGRFARTGGQKIGKAHFVAVPNEIQIETQNLYESNAIWQEIILNLSETRIEREIHIREELGRFADPTIVDFETQDLSLYSLRPYSHVKIYQISESVNINKKIDFPHGFEIVHKRVNKESSISIFITREKTKPRWTHLDMFFRSEHDLFIVYYHAKTRLLFINSSRKSDAIYESLASQFSNGSHKILPLCRVNNVLRELKNPQFFNIGMKNRVSNNNTESYRIITGSSAQDAIANTDGKLYHRGHVFGKALSKQGEITIGYSSASKVWSNQNCQIPLLVEWCNVLAQKIISDTGTSTNSGLDFLPVGKEVNEIPEGIISADWPPNAYNNHYIAIYKDKNGKRKHTDLLDLEIQISFTKSNKKEIRGSICGENSEWEFIFSPATTPMLKASSSDEIILVKGQEKVSLIDYLNNNPFYFYFSDFSQLQGNSFFSVDDSLHTAFNTDQISVIDWASENVDITKEFGSLAGKMSIHDFLKKHLSAMDFDVVFYDHGTGEIADFVTLKKTDKTIYVELYHCKSAGGNAAGSRLGDVYEVCGQTIKSTFFLYKNERLLEKIRKRITRGSTFIKGDLTRLEAIFKEAKSKTTRYGIVLVQPGISKSTISDQCNRVLAASNDYFLRANSEKIALMCSQ